MNLIDRGREVINSQPFSKLLGAQLTRFEVGFAEITLAVSEPLKQHNGIVHGGVLAYLADNAMTFAGGSVLEDVLTLEMKVNYVRPGVGEKLIARASVLSHGRRQAVCRCDVMIADKTGEEKICAAAQGTISSTKSASM
ncbi:uncharacterized protein (TIGR00369 family) [Labrenzia sp. EL_126]|nr:uncharacterized protein (TIGR00369 family) [Labrenzia sp. EL_126]